MSRGRKRRVLGGFLRIGRINGIMAGFGKDRGAREMRALFGLRRKLNGWDTHDG